ncbi:MAG TPA: hypothetical protein IGR64_18010 [Leptolyngbyaceae cyanobacterium M65_K2018_010]|nr:hypothetical protein [Leptolyngbyaceae cyanobacterium M65_K2018_010]
MNIKVIVFSSILTALCGAVLGLGVAEISKNQYVSRHYQDLSVKFALVGAVLGAAVGAGQEAVRELKVNQGRNSSPSNLLNERKL